MEQLVWGTKKYNEVKEEIQKNFKVIPTENFDVKKAIANRIDFLKNFLIQTERQAYVLGISGGVDSSTVGRLCQIACEQLREQGYQAQFIAMRLPAGVQRDEDDAQKALSFIKPDKCITVNIGKSATDLCSQAVEEMAQLGETPNAKEIDWHKGNIKARLRMTSQYSIAGFYKGLVVSTDMNSEYVMSFFTLHGDGASDVTVLGGLNKRQVRLIAKELGASENIWKKPPTADLEELNPGKLDDEGFGFAYDFLDDFLEGKSIPQEVESQIINHFNNTRFKRQVTPGYKE